MDESRARIEAHAAHAQRTRDLPALEHRHARHAAVHCTGVAVSTAGLRRVGRVVQRPYRAARPWLCADGWDAGRLADADSDAFDATGLAVDVLAETAVAFGALCVVWANPVPEKARHRQAI